MISTLVHPNHDLLDADYALLEMLARQSELTVFVARNVALDFSHHTCASLEGAHGLEEGGFVDVL